MSASPLVSSERRLVNIAQACAIVGVSRRTIYHWLQRGRLEYRRTVSGSLRIYEDTLWRDVSQQSRQAIDAHVDAR